MIDLVVFTFIFGIIAGLGLYQLVYVCLGRKNIGSLRIDRSDPEDGPYLFLELHNDISSFENDKYVTLKVVTEGFISQE